MRAATCHYKIIFVINYSFDPRDPGGPQLEFSENAVKSLRKIDGQAGRRIVGFLRERVSENDDPRIQGKSLKGELSAYWRYRVADYRVICDTQDDKLRMLVVDLARRTDIYRGG